MTPAQEYDLQDAEKLCETTGMTWAVVRMLRIIVRILEAAKQKLFDARIEYENAKRAWERLGQEEDGASEEAPSGVASAHAQQGGNSRE